MPGILEVVTGLWAYALTQVAALSTHPAVRPAELLAGAAIAAAALLAVAIAIHVAATPTASADPAGRTAHRRDLVWRGGVPRQLDPDAAGRPRPRAPAPRPSAA